MTVRRMVVAGVTALMATVAAVGFGSAAASGSEPTPRVPLFSGHLPGRAVASVAEAESLAAQQRAAAGAATTGELLILITQNTPGVDVDVPPAGGSPGDFNLFEENVFDRTGATQVGRDSGRCEIVIETFTCGVTILVFGKGKIRIDGSVFFTSPDDLTFPVTGGTDAYEGVGGQVSVFNQPGQQVLVFHLVR